MTLRAKFVSSKNILLGGIKAIPSLDSFTLFMRLSIKNVLLSSSVVLYSSYVYADTAHVITKQPEDNIRFAKPQSSFTEKKSEITPNLTSVTMSRDSLLKNPELIERGFLPSLLEHNLEAINILYPLYKQLDNPDPNLLDWGKAMYLTHHKKYNESISIYQKLASRYPNILNIQYQLALVLFLNNDNILAKEEFEKLKTKNVSSEFIQLIDQYLDAIAKRDEWKIFGGLNYLNESNINNAPNIRQLNNLTFEDKEQGRGFNYHINLDKQWSWYHGLFGKLESNTFGKYYWDNKKYNELYTRIGIGAGYQNAFTGISIIPFVEKNWYSGGSTGSNSLKRFSQNTGVRLNISQVLGDKWQFYTALEYAKQRHVKRKNLDGNNYLFSNTLVYLPNSNQNWSVGVDHRVENTRDKDDASVRNGVRLGWGQQWPANLLTHISLNYAKRTYRGEDIFGILKKNNEYQATLSIWHKNITFWEMIPKVSWSYQKVKSNHPLYNYDKNRIYLEIGRSF